MLFGKRTYHLLDFLMLLMFWNKRNDVKLLKCIILFLNVFITSFAKLNALQSIRTKLINYLENHFSFFICGIVSLLLAFSTSSFFMKSSS